GLSWVHKVRLWTGRFAHRQVARAKGLYTAIRPSAVVVVLDHHRVRAIVSVDGRWAVPSESEGIEELTIRAEAISSRVVFQLRADRVIREGASRAFPAVWPYEPKRQSCGGRGVPTP